MCVEVSRKTHMCGLCAKLKNLLKIHLAKVAMRSNNRTSCVERRKLTLKIRSVGPRTDYKLKAISQSLDKHWNTLCSIKSEVATVTDADDSLPVLETSLVQPDDVITGEFSHSDTDNEIGNAGVASEITRRASSKFDLANDPTKSCPCGKTFRTSRQLKRHRFRNESKQCLVSEDESDSEINVNLSGQLHEVSDTGTITRSKTKIVPGMKASSRKRNMETKGTTRDKHVKRSNRKAVKTKEHTCKRCGDTFHDRATLKLHSKKHGVSKPYVCDQGHCGAAFSSKKSLKSHKLTHMETKHRCKVCQFEFSEPSELHEHMFVHSENGNLPFMCFCGKYFLCAAKLREHQVVHDDARPFVCEICNKAFKRSINLKEHMYIHEENKPFVCRCGKKFAVAPLLRRHETRDHKTKLSEEPSVKSPAYTCEICSATFRRKAFLFRHMKEHVLKNAYACVQCNKQFPTPDSLAGHMCISQNTGSSSQRDPQQTSLCTAGDVPGQYISAEEYDKKIKTYLCELCGKGYANNSKLNEHRKSHTGDTPYTCSICARGFTEKYKLNNHMVIHTSSLEERRNIPCEYCGRCFTTKMGLANHIRTHTGEKPYQCTHCDFRSIQAASLQNHMVTHSTEKKFECKQCPKRFKLKWSLVLHVKRHAGETKHECARCQKRFLTTSQLKKHSYVHSDARPFQCPVCGSAFKRSDALKNHMDRHPDQNREGSKSNATTTKHVELAARQILEHVDSGLSHQSEAVTKQQATEHQINLHQSLIESALVQNIEYGIGQHQQLLSSQISQAMKPNTDQIVATVKPHVQEPQTLLALGNMDAVQFHQYFGPVDKMSL